MLEYFDAFLIGLSATPSKHTLGFFAQNIVAQYDLEQSILDKVNVGYEIFRIKTRISEQGSIIEANAEFQVPFRDKDTLLSLASRLTRLELSLSKENNTRLQELNFDKSLCALANGMIYMIISSLIKTV